MAKPIIWSRTAQKDRLNILDYWAKRNKSIAYSKKLNLLFEQTAEFVRKYPQIGKRTEIAQVRFKVVQHYLFTYRETEEHIEILTIWDSRRDPDHFDRIIKLSSR